MRNHKGCEIFPHSENKGCEMIRGLKFLKPLCPISPVLKNTSLCYDVDYDVDYDFRKILQKNSVDAM